jgi:hypothetical protein
MSRAVSSVGLGCSLFAVATLLLQSVLLREFVCCGCGLWGLGTAVELQYLYFFILIHVRTYSLSIFN